MKLRVQKLHRDAIIPRYAHPGDAGLDFFAVDRTIILAKQWAPIRSGIAIEIPEGYVGLFWDKSGLATKKGLKVLGGVIDSGYRGEMILTLVNLGPETAKIEKGDKVMQLLIQPVVKAEIEVVDELTETVRGADGFGSTGR